MKTYLKNVIVFLLLIVVNSTYAQYNKKVIDSMLEALNSEHNLEQALKKIDHIYIISKKAKYEEGMVRSLLFKAVKYNNARHYEKGFRAIVASESAVRQLNNPKYLALLAILKGGFYSDLGFFQEGKKTLESGIPIARRISNLDERHTKLANIYTGLAQNNQLAKGSINKTFLFCKKSYQEYKMVKSAKPTLIAASEYNLGTLLAELKQYDSARVYLKRAILTSDKYKDYTVKGAAYNNLGYLYFIEKKFHLAVTHYEKGLKYTRLLKSNIDEKNALDGLSETYSALGDKEKAMQYLQRSASLGDSIASADKQAIKAPLGYMVKDKEQQILNNRKKYFKYIVIICLLLFAVLFSFFYYRQKVGIKMKTEDAKMKELLAKLSENSNDRFLLKTEEFKEVVQLAVINSPVFLLKFNELDPGFTRKLKSIAPSLVATEIEFCALLRLNFETKEIARYTNSSVRAVEGKKYRVRKKLQIPSQQDIYLWMNELEYEIK